MIGWGVFMQEIKYAYVISNIEEYGKLISFCIDKDVCVFRSFWDDREKGNRCYSIDWDENKLYYSSISYYRDEGYHIYKPLFLLDAYGNFLIKKGQRVL